MRILIVAAVLAAGCGSAGFDGAWDGTLTQRPVCADGSTPIREIELHLAASVSGDTLSLAGNTSCGTITATVNGDSAALNPVQCAPRAGEGFTYTDAVTGGTISVRGDILDFNATLSTLFRANNGATVLCAGPLTGTLHRRD